jgi:hypothetical protein
MRQMSERCCLFGRARQTQSSVLYGQQTFGKGKLELRKTVTYPKTKRRERHAEREVRRRTKTGQANEGLGSGEKAGNGDDLGPSMMSWKRKKETASRANSLNDWRGVEEEEEEVEGGGEVRSGGRGELT